MSYFRVNILSKHIKTKSVPLVAAFAAVFFYAINFSAVYAADYVPQDVNNTKITLGGPIGFNNLSQAINTVITAVIFFGALTAFVFIVMGAFRYVSAGEDASGVKAARTMITNAVIGMILLGLVFVIFQVVIRLVPGLSGSFSSGDGGAPPACSAPPC